MSGYRVDLQQVAEQTVEFKSLAAKMSLMITQLELDIEALDKGWIGPAKGEYRMHLENLLGDLYATKSDLSNLATTMTNTAKRIHNEDVLAEAERLKREQERIRQEQEQRYWAEQSRLAEQRRLEEQRRWEEEQEIQRRLEALKREEEKAKAKSKVVQSRK